MRNYCKFLFHLDRNENLYLPKITVFFLFFFLFHSVHILTWNVGSKYPDNITVHKLLGLESKPDQDTHRADIYVIGWVLLLLLLDIQQYKL